MSADVLDDLIASATSTVSDDDSKVTAKPAEKEEQERKGESEETMEAAAAPSNYPVVAPYGACGGESSHPCKMAGVCAACTPGWECVPKGRWYSQCLSTGASQGAPPQQESVEEEAVEEPATRDAVPGLGLGFGCGAQNLNKNP